MAFWSNFYREAWWNSWEIFGRNLHRSPIGITRGVFGDSLKVRIPGDISDKIPVGIPGDIRVRIISWIVGENSGGVTGWHPGGITEFTIEILLEFSVDGRQKMTQKRSMLLANFFSFWRKHVSTIYSLFWEFLRILNFAQAFQVFQRVWRNSWRHFLSNFCISSL